MNTRLDDLIYKYATDPKTKEYVEVDGNFTSVLLEKNKVKAIGVAKRNPECDKFDSERGMDIAFARAVKKLHAKLNPIETSLEKKPKKKAKK